MAKQQAGIPPFTDKMGRAWRNHVEPETTEHPDPQLDAPDSVVQGGAVDSNRDVLYAPASGHQDV